MGEEEGEREEAERAQVEADAGFNDGFAMGERGRRRCECGEEGKRYGMHAERGKQGILQCNRTKQYFPPGSQPLVPPFLLFFQKRLGTVS